jgi:predicted TIM-barrel fold metal-dependent hydrolase
MDGLMDEVERLLALGTKGIKLHPDSQRFAIDDPKLYPMYDAIRGRIPVLLHMGDTRYDYSHPVKLRKILDMFPGLDVIAAHFGGYSMYETAYEILKREENCIFDVSSSLMFMPEGVAEHYIGAFGAQRLVFGTDYPLWDPVTETQRFFRLKLTDDQFEQICHKTAENFLKL